MQSIARDSDEGSEDEFFDAQGRQAAPAACGDFLDQMQRIVKGYEAPVTVLLLSPVPILSQGQPNTEKDMRSLGSHLT